MTVLASMSPWWAAIAWITASLSYVLSCNADFDMRALDLMVERLADVVQKTGSACNGGVKAQFGSHHTGKV